VTMNPPYVHKRSRRALLSERRQNDQVMRDSLSLELHVPADCPPVFLVNCVDDPIVEYHNSMLLDSALTAKNIKHKYIQYKTGGHGFGASDEKGTEESRAWRNEFLKWLKENLK
ncbi:MAG: alpha/beta hydrolase, partial [Bacteroidales bacterium]|nr:alpha/beta hydrolase [Bacteroidales bacterium]